MIRMKCPCNDNAACPMNQLGFNWLANIRLQWTCNATVKGYSELANVELEWACNDYAALAWACNC